MKVRKNSAIAFGINLVSGNRIKDAKTDLEKNGSAVHRKSAMPWRTERETTHKFDFPCTKMPLQGKPFTPDMFNCEPVTLPSFPPPGQKSREEKCVQEELERFRSRTASHPSPEKSSSMALSVAWELLKIICVGVFFALKYIFIAAAFIITIGCMICAGRQTREVKYRW